MPPAGIPIPPTCAFFQNPGPRAAPPDGFGRRHTEMTAWLDENCGADCWAMTPSGVRGVLNDAVSIYFLDATLAGAPLATKTPFGMPLYRGDLTRTRGETPPRPGRTRRCGA